jgi:hypothetical protein
MDTQTRLYLAYFLVTLAFAAMVTLMIAKIVYADQQRVSYVIAGVR